MDIPEAIEAVARAVAEHQPVNWDTADVCVDAVWRERLRALKIIAEIAEVHRRPPLDASAEHRWGPFLILERVGCGTYGDVYRALDTRLDREVALKLLRTGNDSTGRIDEARLLARVRHPSVVTIYGADEIDGRVGLWMEFIEGRTLADLVHQQGPLPARDVATVCVDVCAALDAVHDAGLFHRDVKAQNVMRERSGRHVLMDFGAGRTAGLEGAADLVGTPLYIAPEVLNGAPVSRQSDVYSVGVLLFHLATGRYPVEAATIDELRRHHTSRNLIDIRTYRPDLPARMAAAIDRALSHDPDDRYQTAGQMSEATAQMRGDTPERRQGRRRFWTVACVLLLSGILGASFWMTARRATTARFTDVRTQLLWDDATDLDGSTSADGRLLSFVDWNRDQLAVRDLVAGRTMLVGSERDDGLDEKTALSPDGKWIAYTRVNPSPDRGRSNWELRVIGVDGRHGQTALSSRDVYAQAQAWSPDGHWIAAAVVRDHRTSIQLFTRGGTDARTVATGLDQFPSAMCFSPDGRWLAFHVGGRTPSVFTVRAEGSRDQPTPIAAAATLLAWMRDGRLLFTRDREDAAEVYALSIRDGRAAGEPVAIDMPALGRLVPFPLAAGRGFPALGVTPEGGLIYGQTEIATDAVTVSIDPDTGAIGPERVGSAVAAYGLGGLAGGIRYAPDGRRTLYTPSHGAVTIIQSADNATRTVVPQLQSTGRLEWAPDGRSLVIVGARNASEHGIYAVSLETGAASLLVRDVQPFALVRSRDGRTVYYDVGNEPQVTVVAHDVRSGIERPIWTPGKTVMQLRLSTDGRRLTIMTRNGIDVLNLSTRQLLFHSDAPAGAKFWGGDWAPDGHYLFATVSYGDVHPRVELWRIPLDSSAPERHALAAPAIGGWMRADGREFSMIRRQDLRQVWRIDNALTSRGH